MSARILDPSWVKKLVLNTLLKGDRRKDFRACKRPNVPQKCQCQDCYTCTSATPAMTDQVSQAKYAKPSEQFCTKETQKPEIREIPMLRCLFEASSMSLRCVPGTVPGTCRSLCHARRPSSSSVKANRGVAKDLHQTCYSHYRVTYRVLILLCYRKRKDEKDEKHQRLKRKKHQNDLKCFYILLSSTVSLRCSKIPLCVSSMFRLCSPNL